MLAQPTRREIYDGALVSRKLIPQNERELRRSEGSVMLIGDPLVRGAMIARPTSRATFHRALESRELIPQNERAFTCSQWCVMLIVDPLW